MMFHGFPICFHGLPIFLHGFLYFPTKNSLMGDFKCHIWFLATNPFHRTIATNVLQPRPSTGQHMVFHMAVSENDTYTSPLSQFQREDMGRLWLTNGLKGTLCPKPYLPSFFAFGGESEPPSLHQGHTFHICQSLSWWQVNMVQHGSKACVIPFYSVVDRDPPHELWQSPIYRVVQSPLIIKQPQSWRSQTGHREEQQVKYVETTNKMNNHFIPVHQTGNNHFIETRISGIGLSQE